jgi:hypothetical protein
VSGFQNSAKASDTAKKLRQNGMKRNISLYLIQEIEKFSNLYSDLSS